MRNSHGVTGIGGAAIAALLTIGATVAMQAQSARNDGITVHGHWTIDIVNPDGRLASHNEFENALEATGTTALSGVLARNFVPAAWQLTLYGVNGSGACERAAAPPPISNESLFAIVAPGYTVAVVNGQLSITQDPVGTGGLTPLAPVFTNVTPALSLSFNYGNPIDFDLMAMDPDGDSFTTTVIGAPPGLALFGPGTPSEPLHWDTGLVPAGSYSFSIALADNAGHSNTYQGFAFLVAPPPPDPGAGQPVPCIAVEPNTGIPTEFANAWFPTLGFTVVEDSPFHQHLELTGNVTAAIPEPVTQVQSVLRMTNGATLPFSARTLDTPIQVVAGQRIYVKVVLSFT